MCLAVPGRIVTLVERDGTQMAVVDFDGIQKEICVEFLSDIGVGDYALIHVGFAISKIDEESALESLALLREIGTLSDELAESETPGVAEASEEATR